MAEAPTPVVLFTDFGTAGPYLGQLRNVLLRTAPAAPVISLFADAPAHDAQASAYLLAAYAPEFPAATVVLAVVDPGVGTARPAIVLAAGGLWYVGPENGLFEIVGRRAAGARWWPIDWRPETLSATFHGRDLFAPIAARLASGRPPDGAARPFAELARADWPDDLARVIYLDHFGNAMSGLRAAKLPDDAELIVAGHALARRRTYADVGVGDAFWYENANGLAEIAINQERAADRLGLSVGTTIEVQA